MKDPSDRTKVLLRHLPPAISQLALMEQIDGRFAGRYERAYFRPGKNSQKNQRYSLAYIDFKRPEDVVEFAEFFDGHIFVNEKGAQFKALVEYAPSQRVPKPCSKKDGREGTIFKDPEYLEFLELISKPVENLPSAEIQLERREAERSGASKEMPIVTPLMDFVRQKRAAKRTSGNGKLSRKSRVVSANSSSPSSRRGSGKQRGPTSIYVARDSTINGAVKNKSTFILAQRREEQHPPDKSVPVASLSGTDVIQDETANGVSGTISGASGAVQTGKRLLLLLKGNQKDSPASGGLSQEHNITSSARNSPSSTASRQNQRRETSGRIIRTILSNKEGRHSPSFTVASQSEQQLQTVNLEKDKRPPRPPARRPILRNHVSNSSSLASVSDSDWKNHVGTKAALNDQHAAVSIIEKNDKRMRNKDRPDRGVWSPLYRSDRSHASEETPAALAQISDSLQGVSAFQQVALVEFADYDIGVENARVGHGSNSLGAPNTPLGHGEIKPEPTASRSLEIKSLGGGRVSLSAVENGSHRHVGRRGTAHGFKEVESSLNLIEGKFPKRGATGYSSHERQVWIQKSGSAS